MPTWNIVLVCPCCLSVRPLRFFGFCRRNSYSFHHTYTHRTHTLTAELSKSTVGFLYSTLCAWALHTFTGTSLTFTHTCEVCSHTIAQLKSSLGTQMHVHNRGQLPNCSWVGRCSDVTIAFCPICILWRAASVNRTPITTGLPRDHECPQCGMGISIFPFRVAKIFAKIDVWTCRKITYWARCARNSSQGFDAKSPIPIQYDSPVKV